MVRARLLSLVLALLALATPAWAQGPLVRGVFSQGGLAVNFEEDVWTLSGVTAGHWLYLGTKNLGPASFQAEFYVDAPSGPTLYFSGASSGLGGWAKVQAMETGTYTVRVKHYFQSSLVGDYALQLIEAPGANVVPPGDQGGALTNGVLVPAQLSPGDVDAFTFVGCVGATPNIQLSEVPPNPANQFGMGLVVYNATGVEVESQSTSATLDLTMNPLLTAGTYTVVVVPSSGITGPNDYSLKITGMCGGAPGPPNGQADTYTVTFNTPLTVPAPGVLGNDSSPGGLTMSASIVGQPQHGAVALNANGSFTYTPTGGYSGQDAFTYRPSDGNGQGNITTVSLSVTAPAQVNPPTNFFAKLILGSTVLLQWTPPSSGLSPTAWVLEAGLSPGTTLGSLTLNSLAPGYTITAPNGSFYLRVKTVAGNQTSTASNEILIHVGVPVAPSAPSGLLATVNGNALSLAWKNTFTGGAPTGIRLQVSGSVSGTLDVPLTDHLDFPNVVPGTYTLSVHAINASGVSAASNSVTVSVPSACTGVPLTPADVVAYRVGSTLFLGWEPSPSGPAPASFTVKLTGALNATVPVGPIRFAAGAVGPGSYTLQVAATNACGGSAFSSPVSVTVP